jgi:hypothetical protein
MPRMHRTRGVKRGTGPHSIACGLGFALLWAGIAAATPYDYLPVGDPIESELRTLDLLDSRPLQGRILLPHLGTRPLQLMEIEGIGAPPDSPDVVRSISIARIERALGRDRGPLFAPHAEYGSTPRVLDYGSELQLLQLSAGLEGRAETDRYGTRLASGSGLHGRVSMGLDRLVAHAHYVVGQIDHARAFADPIIPNNDLIVLPDETYLSYTEERGQWGVQFGRNRWHWGPGEEGSLVLSKTSAVFTGLAFHTRISSLRADAITLAATLEEASGEQLAAHRIEWQPLERLRLGVSEAARYRAPRWRSLYLMGAIPYVIVERLERQNEPDSLRALRNNVLTAFDATWRVADGTRLYGEILVDDIAARSGKYPNKIGYQLGWEGVGPLGRTRVSWGGEFTRITRFVYTSFFGRDHVLQDRALGFPVAPDVRRIRLRTAWDLGPDWQLSARVTHTDKGENDLDEPFMPRSPRVDSFQFEGVVEKTREVEFGLRWWPASGVNLHLAGAYHWVDNSNHLRGAADRGASGAVEFSLMR